MNGETDIYIPRERNQAALTEEQIKRVRWAWQFLNRGQTHSVEIDFSNARRHSGRTVYDEGDRTVHIGPDVYPGTGRTARARMSILACLAHEFSHAERHRKKRARSAKFPDLLIDEAETNLDASFMSALRKPDRMDLVEAGSECLANWLQFMRKGENRES